MSERELDAYMKLRSARLPSARPCLSRLMGLCCMSRAGSGVFDGSPDVPQPSAHNLRGVKSPRRDTKGVIVTAQAIMGVSMGRDIKAFGRGVVGGRSSAYEEEVAKGVRDALKELEDAAAALGADAVVALDLDYAEVGKHMLMVAASGTAVKLG